MQVERLATSLLARTKDLRVMLYLTRLDPAARVAGLRRRADADPPVDTPLLGCSATGIEFDGEADPLFRINALADLGDKAALAASVRTAPLLKSAAGEISLRDAGALLDGSKQECPTFPARLQDELAQQGRPKAHW